MKKWLYGIILTVLLFFVFLIRNNLHDRFPGYSLDLKVIPGNTSSILAAFSKTSITPVVHDSWKDVNGNLEFDADGPDTWTDGNGNGKFDPVWLAGFHNNRPAQGVHDSLWARTMIIDDGATRIAVVAIDAIGFGADDALEVRQSFPKDWKITHAFIVSSHSHQAPDLIGIYGKSKYVSGVDQEYLDFVKSGIKASVGEAVGRLRPVELTFARNLEDAKELVTDLRDPHVTDHGLRIIHARDTLTGETLGTLVSWANHPETLEDKNLLVSSDYVHYLREGIEKGVRSNEKTLHPGTGGITVFINGAIGGMMTTWSGFPITDPFTGQLYKDPDYKKTEAQGLQLAMLSLKAIDSSATKIKKSSISLRALSVELPLDNSLYRLGAVLGIFSRGLSGIWEVRSEVAAWKIGPATFLHLPGELYPEIANGGIEMPEGGDFAIRPVEVPALRSKMPGEYHFVVGLSNDLIGYIIPKSQWDEKAPFTYNSKEAPYGEINSLGPETGPLIYNYSRRVLRELP